MGLIFKSDFHDGFGTWALGYIPYGGADFGEVLEVANAVGDGGDDAFHDAWTSAADRFAQAADEALRAGHEKSACEFLLRASVFYASSYHPLYGYPVDPRVRQAFRRQAECLGQGLALLDQRSRPLRIPLEGTSMPGHFIPAEGTGGAVRPLIILTNGYDGTMADMVFASAIAATRRGYHCLLFDGPGQGEMLIEQGVPIRPDWETVVGAVVDVAETLPLVDPKRIALSGWSLGGYLAPRAASGEHRLAACIADPGQWCMVDTFRHFAIMMGATPEEARNLGDLDGPIVEKIWETIQADRKLRWSIVQRGFWVHGVTNLRDYARSAEAFTLEERAGSIRCPTLIAAAEGDPLATAAPKLFDALTCPKTLIHFAASEGAGGHCQMRNRSLLNRRVLDWLDDVIAN